MRTVFAFGLVFGLAAFVVAAVFLDEDLRMRVFGGPVVAPPPVEPAVPVVEKRARIRVVTKPADASILEHVEGGLPVLLGTAPLTLDWRLRDGAPRILLVKRQGFADARTEVRLPPGESAEPVLLEVEIALTPAR